MAEGGRPVENPRWRVVAPEELAHRGGVRGASRAIVGACEVDVRHCELVQGLIPASAAAGTPAPAIKVRVAFVLLLAFALPTAGWRARRRLRGGRRAKGRDKTGGARVEPRHCAAVHLRWRYDTPGNQP